MQHVDAHAAALVAAKLTIQHQRTGALAPLLLEAEQQEILRLLSTTKRLIILKGRQVGASTVCCLYDLLFAWANPGVSVLIMADVEDKAKGLLAKCSQWARRLGIKLKVDNVLTLELYNGSKIVAKSAIARAPGTQHEVGTARSMTFSLVHFSELAFYSNDRAVFAAVTATANLSAQIVVESTATAAHNLFRDLWDGVENGWAHYFASVEDHAAYRLPPDAISDATWAEAQARFAFTRRDTAAWWVTKLKRDFFGDTYKMMREYPVHPQHAFLFAAGRWIQQCTIARDVVYDAATGFWLYTTKGRDELEPVILGVDTGKGVGRDSSVIAVVGERTGSMIGYYKRNDVDIASFIDVVKTTCERWEPVAVVVESNGVGQATYHTARTWRWWAPEQVSGAGGPKSGEKDVRMRRTGRAIETGQIRLTPSTRPPAGVHDPSLEVEYEGSVINAEKGVWEGPDDGINAISFALKHRALYAANDGVPEDDEDDEGRFSMQRFLRAGRRRA